MNTDFYQTRMGELDVVVARHAQADAIDGAVVLCHGFGAPGTDLVPVSVEIFQHLPQLKNVLFVFPAAPLTIEPGFDGRAWWPIDMDLLQRMIEAGEFRDLGESKPERLERSRDLIEEVIAQCCESFSLERKQIVIGGFSQGAMLTTHVMLKSESPLGGLVIWSGALINESEWRRLVADQSAIPIVQSHGRTDPILPMVGAEALRELLVGGGFPVQFIAFDGPHTIPPQAIEAAAELIGEVLGKPATKE